MPPIPADHGAVREQERDGARGEDRLLPLPRTARAGRSRRTGCDRARGPPAWPCCRAPRDFAPPRVPGRIRAFASRPSPAQPAECSPAGESTPTRSWAPGGRRGTCSGLTGLHSTRRCQASIARVSGVCHGASGAAGPRLGILPSTRRSASSSSGLESRPPPRTGRLQSSVHGSSIDPTEPRKSLAFRVTRTRWCATAVAASNPSTAPIGRPPLTRRAMMRPHDSATAMSTGRIRPSNLCGRSVRSHSSRRWRRRPGASRSTPARSSPSVSTLRKTPSSSTSPSQVTTRGLGVGFTHSDTTLVSSR